MRMSLVERFGGHLRSLRQARGLTQEVLAERSDLSVDAIRRIERGKLAPSLTTLGKLANGLDLALGTLVEGLDAPHRVEVREVSDLLAKRPLKEVRMVGRLLRAMFAE